MAITYADKSQLSITAIVKSQIQTGVFNVALQVIILNANNRIIMNWNYDR